MPSEYLENSRFGVPTEIDQVEQPVDVRGRAAADDALEVAQVGAPGEIGKKVGVSTIAPMRRSVSGFPAGSPKMRALPDVGFTSPSRLPMVVVLPEPSDPGSRSRRRAARAGDLGRWQPNEIGILSSWNKARDRGHATDGRLCRLRHSLPRP